MSGATEVAFGRVSPAGGVEAVVRAVPDEVPVAVEVNGIGYAVLMATPQDIADLVAGFLFTERLIGAIAELIDVDVAEVAAGIVARATVVADAAARLGERIRHRTSDSSCGLCGIENLEQALRPLPPIRNGWRGKDAAIFAAAADLDGRQPLNAATRAVHAAARCDAAGRILDVREDVGRHNAFDKLIGAMLREGVGWAGGFALLSSRCSFELVEKAVLARCPLLATISAPTSLAVARAREAGLALRTIVRADALLAPVS